MTATGQRVLLVSVAALAAAVALATMAGAAPQAVRVDGEISTLAGNGESARGPGVDGVPATEAPIDHPRGLAVDAEGNVYVAEPFRHVVQRIGVDGRITRVAGTGEPGYSGDGAPAVEARIQLVHMVSLLPGGGFVLADTANDTIRRVWPDGRITTVAGTGAPGYSGDGGPATAAHVQGPRSVTALPDGGFLIPDTGNDRIRRVWPDGTITTLAGSGVRGFSGDGGPALAAQFNYPFSVAPLPDGGVLVADAGNNRIRRVYPDGTVRTVAGTGTAGFGGDGGPAVGAELNAPHAVAALPDGGFLATDTFNNRVRRVWPDGTITTVAGTGTAAYSGDGGPATQAALDLPKAIAILPDRSGFLVGDAANNRIRVVTIDLRPALRLRLVVANVRAKTGRAAMLRYVLSERAGVRLTVLRGEAAVLRKSASGRAGRNRLSFGSGLRPGAYRFRLDATTADRRAARATGSLTVSR